MIYACWLGWHDWYAWEKHGEPEPFVTYDHVKDDVTEVRKKIQKGQGWLHTQRRTCRHCGREQFATHRVGVNV